MYVKITELGSIIPAPVNKGDIVNYNLNPILMLNDGYKLLVQTDRPEGDYKLSYVEKESTINEVWILLTQDELNESNKQDVDAFLLAIAENSLRISTAETAELDDETLNKIGKAGYFDEWASDTDYKANKRLIYNGTVYVVMQDIKSQSHQTPGSTGMLAIYRPTASDAGGGEPDGTIGNPISYIYGMDVYNGKYYIYNGITYLAKADMKPCVWYPGTVGMWQWEQVVEIKYT